MKYYQKKIDDVIQYYGSDPDHGLTANKAEKRLKRDGFNKLPKSPPPSLLAVFFLQFQNPLIYILLVAATIIFFVGNRIDAFIISFILIFNAILGTVQERRTQTILDSLQQFLVTTSIVIRDGQKVVIADEKLVVGDIILLQEGEKIPVDARIILSNNLTVDESILTGESKGVQKTSDTLSGSLQIADQTNTLFKGTSVFSGSARAIVVATGVRTEVGRIHKSIAGIRTEIPLKRDLDSLSNLILVMIFFFCIVLLVIGLVFGKSFTELLVTLTALFICVVPEGLPVVLTLVLVSGANRMARQNVLIKRLQAVDTLGRTEVAIIDKTGTLTRNEMIVTQVYASGVVCNVSGVGYFKEGAITCDGRTAAHGDNTSLDLLATAGVLLNRAELEYVQDLNLFKVKGEPLEAAMYIFSQKLGIDAEVVKRSYDQVFEIPFDRDYAYHAAFYRHNGRGRAFVAGAPEMLRDRCSNFDKNAQKALDKMLAAGLRVVGVGTVDVDPAAFKTDGRDEFLFFKELLTTNVKNVGFFGIQDSIRPEVALIVSEAREAGIHVVMATGDHKETALFVARRVGIFREGDEVIEGKEFPKLSQQGLLKRLSRVTVFARVTPEHKLTLVKSFHKLDKIVAMTGDGVNDTPPLVAADVGVAMGGIGTEVAKEAADVVLLDDSFSNIINAIEQGRHILYALRRVILYFFATNLGEVLVVFFALILNFPLPILAAQILWLNLVTDGFLEVALAMEPKEQGLLKKQWFTRGWYLIDRSLIIKTFYMAIPMGIGSLLIFNAYYQADIVKARTMTFVTMALYQWFNAWNCRSETKSFFQLKWFSNKWLILATFFVGILQVLVVNVTIMQRIFHTVPLTTKEFGLIILITGPLFLIEEVRKWVAQTFLKEE